jgi:hypothetical protein
MTANGTAGVTVSGGKFTVQTKGSSPTTLFDVDSSNYTTTLSGDVYNKGTIFSGCTYNSTTGLLTKTSGATGNIYAGGLIQSFGGIINQNTLRNDGLITSRGGIVNTGIIDSSGLIYSDGLLAAGSDVVFYASFNRSTGNVTGYKPVIRIEDTGSPDCFWSATAAVDSNTWTTVALPAPLRGKVVSVAVSAHQNKQSLYRPTNSSGKNGTDYNTAELTGFIANAWYVDYKSDSNNIWVFNGQSQNGTINLIVAARVM